MFGSVFPSQLFWYLGRVRPWPVSHLAPPLGGLALLLLRMVPPNPDPDLIIKMKIHPHQTRIIRIHQSLQIKAKLWSLTMLVSWFFFFFWNEINGKIAPFYCQASHRWILESPHGFLDSFCFCFISSWYSLNYWIILVISLAFLKKCSLLCLIIVLVLLYKAFRNHYMWYFDRYFSVPVFSFFFFFNFSIFWLFLYP